MSTKHTVPQFPNKKGSTEGSCKDCPINHLPAPDGGSTSGSKEGKYTKTYSVKQFKK
jgi:hypothetical protein